MSFLVFTCHLYYAPLKGKSGPKFCELSVNNKRAGPNKVQASSQTVDKVIFAKKTTSKMFQMQLLC